MKFPRLFGWLIATILLLCSIALLAPQQLPVSLYKLSLVTMAGVVGYWLDRSIFPYGRPDAFICPDTPLDIDADMATEDRILPFDSGDAALALLFGIATLRRAFIVGAAMIAMGIGA